MLWYGAVADPQASFSSLCQPSKPAPEELSTRCEVESLSSGSTSIRSILLSSFLYSISYHERLVSVQDNRKSTLALRAFNDFLLSDARVDCSLVPIGDGMALCRRL